MSRENIIEKIKKLRQLINSNNLNEATAAAHIAEKLIQEHSLQEFELELPIEESSVFSESPVVSWNARVTNWQATLIVNLCTAYNCTNVLMTRNGKFGIYLAGRNSDIDIVKYQYAYFISELTRISHKMAPSSLQRGSGKRWYNSFYFGAVDAISLALKASKKEVMQNAKSTALVAINKRKEAAMAAMASAVPGTFSKKKVTSSSIDKDAYCQGQKAGSNMSIKQALSENVRGLLK